MEINELILGSTSPFRSQILRQAKVDQFRQIAPQVDESSVCQESPILCAEDRSKLKAKAMFSETNAIAITGDQVLEYKGKVFNKARNRPEAFAILRTLSGERHHLHSAYTISLIQKNQPVTILKSSIVSTTMWMKDLSDREIDVYLDSGEWEGCAGCYQFENLGVHLFKKIEGESSAIMGLPMPQILHDLRTFGVNLLLAPQGPWTLNESVPMT